MLYCFGFESVGVVVGDLYFFDAAASSDQQGAERGVRLELRVLEREELVGSVYSAQPIHIGRPIWRVDLLETAAGKPGSFDRTHYHPRLVDWEPVERVFDPELSSEPIAWVGRRLEDLDSLLADAGLDEADLADGGLEATARQSDAASLRATTPEILDTVSRLLARVHAGELANAPDVQQVVTTRIGWL